MHSKFRDGTLAALSIGVAACSGNPTIEAPAPANDPKADWTMLGYDVASTYWNRAETRVTKKTAPKLEKAWEFDGGASVTSTPVISAGKVYVVSDGVIAIDLASGKELWRNQDLSGSSSLALAGNVLYMNDKNGVIRALKVQDGSEIWNYQTPDLPESAGFSSPIPTKDLVLFSLSTNEELNQTASPIFRGFVGALNKDGSLAWQKYTVEGDEKGATLWSTVSVDETLGIVYGGTGNNHGPPAGTTSDAYIAIPLATGDKFIWTKQIFADDTWSAYTPGPPDNDFGANPVVFDFGGKKLVAGGNKGGDFWVLDRATGDQVAKVNLGPNNAYKGGIFVSGAWDGKHLLAVCNGATSGEPGSITPEAGTGTPSVLYALDPLTLDTVWARQIIGPSYSPITVANGVGFFGQRSTLQAFDTESGDILMEFPTEGTIATAPAVSNGYVVFGSGMTWFESSQGTKYYALKVP